MNKLFLVLALLAATALAAAPAAKSPAAEVNPFIGTGGHGHTFPGAVAPSGMVQLSPDTRLEGWDGCSGYHYSDDVIYGFSHTHLSGTGCSDYGDILLMPVTGETPLQYGDPLRGIPGYASRFRHETEAASPGLYKVRLDGPGIDVRLSATARAGFHEYRYPAGAEAGVVLDLVHRDEVLAASLRIAGPAEVEGMRRSRAWADDQHVFFVIRFSRPVTGCRLEQDEKPVEAAAGAGGEKARLRARFGFGPAGPEPLRLKIGLSTVSIDGARRNLEAEIPGWDFETVYRATAKEWDRVLSRLQIRGGTAEERQIFYTALYHNWIHPNLAMDVDGRYRGRDGKVHQADGFSYYTVFSLWDTFRATHPLYTLIGRRQTSDFINTFIRQYEEGGLLPVWELSGCETNCMIGYHAVPVIADAFVKGIGGFDAEKALAAMIHSASQVGRGLAAYRRLGFIPAGEEPESVSKTLEYAYDDWCIARMAEKLGKSGLAREYGRRAQYYKNLFDPGTGFMRARVNGGWAVPFDPREVNFNFTEANSWQYSFFVPQDVDGLATLLGGPEKLAARLDDLFSAPAATTGRDQADITGLIGQYAHGNEPSQHIAYLYNFTGRPWKTQAMVRRIMKEFYSARPDGLIGNDDCGQTSAWYLLSALGFYPVTPGSDEYILGSPLFPEASLQFEDGKVFTIRAEGVSSGNMYIQSARLNGKPFTRSWIRHRELTAGGELVLVMGASTQDGRGSAAPDRPRSAITGIPYLPAPFTAEGIRILDGRQEIRLGCAGSAARIRYTLNGSEPDRHSPVYAGPVQVEAPATLKFYAEREGFPDSAVITACYHPRPVSRQINLRTAYSPQYPGGGDLALVDGLTGGNDFRDGLWQGYHGVNLDVVVDLLEVREISGVEVRFIQDQRSWIFLPEEVSCEISLDGRVFEPAGKVVTRPADEGGDAPPVKVYAFPAKVRARYLRIAAKNRGVCPPGHPGAGQPAWIFADEITAG